jgi:hypothetical protein
LQLTRAFKWSSQTPTQNTYLPTKETQNTKHTQITKHKPNQNKKAQKYKKKSQNIKNNNNKAQNCKSHLIIEYQKTRRKNHKL